MSRPAARRRAVNDGAPGSGLLVGERAPAVGARAALGDAMGVPEAQAPTAHDADHAGPPSVAPRRVLAAADVERAYSAVTLAAFGPFSPDSAS